MTARYDLNDDSVFVIVGSGAGGGTLANELAQKGVDVVVLEAGPRYEKEEHIDVEWESFNQLSWLDMRSTSGSWGITNDFPTLPTWTCKVVGGTTVHWAGCSIRFKDYEFNVASEYGSLDGANLLDWPISLDDVLPYYDKAEDKLGVTGRHGIPYNEPDNNQMVMAAGAKNVGYEQVTAGTMAINPVPRDGRPGTMHDGFCFQGIASNARWSTLNTEIPKGEATGHLEVRPEAHVLQVQHNGSGKITGVLYADADGNQHVQKARGVSIAGNSIESPRLLLNSASSQHPDGLANSSGQVGKNYMRHTTGTVWGIFDNPVNMYRGNTMAGCVSDEARNDPDRGFFGGYYFQTLHLGPSFMGAFVDPGAWGRGFADDMEGYENMAGMWIVGEDMPQESNGVTLHETEKDQHGMPIPNVHFDDHPNDVAMRNHAYEHGSAIYDSLGARKTIHTPPYPATHNLGTCRMSARPEDGVVNKWGQTHDVSNLFISDGSQMTTGAAANPTLTITSLAIRQADYIAEQMKAGQI
ncbi:MAG: GMC family oxidoreductase [Rubrobacter sp.]|nr:GMC family oxidoreductase [Rubrobacter sp.]